MPFPRLNRLRTALRDPKRWKRWGIEVVILLAVAVGVTLWQNRGLAAGPAPGLVGLRTDGILYKLGAGGAAPDGRSRLVAFWATWCGVCRAEAGNVEAVARDWPVVSVAMQSGERAEVANYLAAKGLELPAVDDDDGDISKAWGVRVVPTHFVLDPAGNIRFRVVGYATEWGLRLRLWWAQNVAA